MSNADQHMRELWAEEAKSLWVTIISEMERTGGGMIKPQELFKIGYQTGRAASETKLDLLYKTLKEVDKSIKAGLDTANGRESEWGDRAKWAFEHFEKANAAINSATQ